MFTDYWQVGLAFVGACLALLVSSALFTLGGIKGIKQNFKEQKGKSILSGILLVSAFVVAISVVFVFGASKTSALELEYFDYVEVEAGIVYTKSKSPQCKSGGIDDKATSDIRAALNLVHLYSEDSRLVLDINGEILHHSGAFCVDDRPFDSIGPKARLRWNF